MHLRPVPSSPTPRPAPVRAARVVSRPRRSRARGGFLLAVLTAVGLAGCGGTDPFGPNPASIVETQETVFQVYPLSIATGSLQSAVNLASLTAVRPALTLAAATGAVAPNFDFAVDRAADGRVRLLPAKLVVGLGGAGLTLQTGFQVVTTAFDALDAAPNGTYQADSVTTVGVGQTVVVEAQSLTCYGLSRPNVYAKLVVDSVAAGTGPVYLRARVDQNCGFRSLKVGKPTS